MRVDGPGVGARGAVDERGARGRGGGPQAEGAVDVEPGAGGAGGVADGGERIAGAAVDVAGLRANDGAVVERRQAVGAHAALRVGGHDDHALATEAEHAERLGDGDVDLFADDDRERRGAEEAVARRRSSRRGRGARGGRRRAR